MPNRPMIKNGPKIMLNSAPGRRMTSRTSLPTKAVVRVQLLSSPANASRSAPTTLLLFEIQGVCVVSGDQRSKDFVEGRAVFGAGDDFATERVHLLDDARHGRAGLVSDHQEVPRRVLTDLADAGQILELHRVECMRGCDLDDVAAKRRAAELLRRRQRNESAAVQNRHAVAVLGFADDLGGYHERPTEITQAPELRPDLSAQDGIEAGGGLVHEQQLRVMHQRAGKLETTLHPA